MRILVNSVVLIAFFMAAPVWADDSVEKAGDVLQLVLPLAALGQTLDAHDHVGSRQFLKSAALANGITHTLKPALNYTRPNGKSLSFPSGHTTSAFVGAAFFQRRYGWKIGLPAYALAGFVGYSRIESHNHYPVDVLAGAAIGIGSAYLFTSPMENLSIEPYFTGDETGVAARIRW